ncbi:hypothetical protein D3C81_1486940 [compost metagenome]
MAQLVAQHATHFIVGHHVHQAAVDAHAAVGHGPGIDVLGQVHPYVEIGHVAVLQPAHDLGEAPGVVGARAGGLVGLVGLGTGLVRERFHIRVGQGGGLRQRGAGGHQAVDIGAGATGKQGGGEQRKYEKAFHSGSRGSGGSFPGMGGYATSSRANPHPDQGPPCFRAPAKEIGFLPIASILSQS